MAHVPGRSRPSLPLAAVGAAGLLILSVAALIPSASAQTPAATVSGRVASFGTERPLEGARIDVVDTHLVALTDAEGRFLIEGVPAGDRFLRVAFRGTVSQRLGLRVRDGRAHEVEILVGVDVVPLPALRVSIATAPAGKLTGFHRRRERGFGVFITREEIERRDPMQTSDLFRTVTGIRVGPHRATGRTRTSLTRGSRGCPVDYFLDGMRTPGLHVDDVAPEEIDGIEIYRGPAEVPASFRRRLTCAAVLIWTRDPARP